MGLGNTQLYNIKRIYNHKRHEDIKLGNKVYQFRRKPKFPKKLTQEDLVIDLLNNLDSLAEDNQTIGIAESLALHLALSFYLLYAYNLSPNKYYYFILLIKSYYTIIFT